MKAMLHFANGDRQEITLNLTQMRAGHPHYCLMWRDGTPDSDGNCEVGGRHVGERCLYLDLEAYAATRTVRFVEPAPRAASLPIRSETKP